jgi:alginate O-acetyltransferase complex protein AlgI
LVALGVALGLGRGQIVSVPWPAAIWPILGSMFMFRLIVYLYDLKHQPQPPTVWQSLSYFFLLPNVVFPLFPVVDSATFRRTYYDGSPNQIYQQGVQWMLLGLVHLLVYRFVYHRLVIAPSAVDSVPALLYYLITSFLLYFRVSGQFHLIIGMLHLFGFRLPKTYNYFLLASSFMDLWRRNNIYWKDFMMKVFYYPMYFRIKKLGNTKALVISLAVVVVVTWALHAAQWFWILGVSSFSGPDTAFWTVMGLGMITSLLLENRRKARRTRGSAWSFRISGVLAAKTIGFFLMFVLLWSLFMSPTFEAWFSLFGGVRVTVDGVTRVVGMVALAWVLFVLANRLVSRARASGWTAAAWTPARGVPVTAVGLLLLVSLANPGVSSEFPIGARQLIADLRLTELNAQDAERLQQGYYENLTGVSRFNGQLWEVYAQRPKDWPIIEETEAVQPTGDIRGLELRPLTAMYFKGAPFRTNRWGMRDKDYEQVPPPNTYRIALLGASYVMGSGVNNGETFEAVLERRLNADAAAEGGPAIEILNFAVGGYSQAQQLAILENRVFSFAPNCLFVVGHHRDGEIAARYLARARRDGVENPFPFTEAILDKAGVTASTPDATAERLMLPYQDELLAGIHHAIVEAAVRRGITPVWIYLVPPGALPSEDIVEKAKAMARDAGYQVIDLGHVFDGHDAKSLHIAAWDTHPNAEAHAMIAERLYQVLHEQQARLNIPVASGVPGQAAAVHP